MTSASEASVKAADVGEPRLTHVAPARGVRINFREVWAHRELLFFFVWRDLKVRFKQTLIGAAWAVIQPVALMLVFTVFFGRLGRLPSDGIPYPIFYYCALVPWVYFSQALSSATNTIVQNRGLITKVYFPRLLLPLSSVISPLVDFAISLVVLAGLMIYYGIAPGLRGFLTVPFLALALLTALGAGLWFAALNAIYRDVRYAVPIIIQFWMFASPVAYPSSLVPPSWRSLYGLNPMAGVIEGFRWALTGRGLAPGPLTLASAGAVLVVLFSGLWYFRRSEGYIADVV